MSVPCPPRILIADDDASIRRAVARLLSQRGFTCDDAASAEEVRQRLEQADYDVLVSDINMPGNTQLEMIADLRQVRAGLPIVVLTGAPTMETAVQCIRLSVVAYLLKPVQSDELVDHINQALGRRRVAQSVVALKDRLRTASEELSGIETALRGTGSSPVQACAQAFMGVAFQNAALSLSEVRRVLETLNANTGAKADQDQTTRYLALLQALSETVLVLERTKSSFKSRELADLRRKIEGLLQADLSSEAAADHS